uniref:CHCH domain-containing protein n=1 Tax=Ditylenchus dipsaci TaxID=166011 RepID=A0A915EEZ7_9BILA
MRVTDSLLKKSGGVLPRKWTFSEYIPLASSNLLVKANRAPSDDKCVGDLRNLFECMKTHEYDDLPCSHIHEAFMRCVHETKEKAARTKAINKDSPIGEQIDGKKTLTVGQFNKLMQRFPQPDLGSPPYHHHRRLPSQMLLLCLNESWPRLPSKTDLFHIVPHEDWQQDPLQCQASSLAPNKAEVDLGACSPEIDIRLKANP